MQELMQKRGLAGSGSSDQEMEGDALLEISASRRPALCSGSDEAGGRPTRSRAAGVQNAVNATLAEMPSVLGMTMV
jgi:hypothetical protein